MNKKPRIITARQRAVALDIASGRFPSKEIPTEKELLVRNGYSETQALTNPKEVVQSLGVQTVLDELGFNEESAKRVNVEIMEDRDIDAHARLRATENIFKVFGTYAPEKKHVLVARVPIKNEELEKIRQEYEEKVKQIATGT